LVASPHTLGDIRSSLSAGIQGLVTAEVNKDLIKMSEKEIEDHLAEIVWF
jgi:protein required for attachment to host cells